MLSLKLLPPAIMRQIADDLRSTAKDLDKAAYEAEIHQKVRTRSIAARRAIELAGLKAQELADGGMTLDQAAATAVRHYHNLYPGLDSRQVYFVADHKRKIDSRRKKKIDQMTLERSILTHWRAGLTDKEIGLKLGKHPKSIARTRRAAMDDVRILSSLDESVQRIKARDEATEASIWTAKK